MLFKNKYNKLERKDVSNAILNLQEEQNKLEESLVSSDGEIKTLMERGRKETNRSLKVLWAKKINMIKSQTDNKVQRIMYLMYNIQLLEKLKDAIDDKNFIGDLGKVPLNKLLADQKGLAKFLNKALNNKVKSEDIMTAADETFKDVQLAYQPNEAIYGVGKTDDELLAMFETQEALDDEHAASEIDNAAKKKGALPNV